MLYVPHTARHGETCAAGTDQAAETEQAMKRGHERTAVVPLDFHRLRVHRDIEHAIPHAEQHQRGYEQAYGRTDNGQRKGQAEPQRGDGGQAAAAETAAQPYREGPRQCGARRPRAEGLAGRGKGSREASAIERRTRPSCPSSRACRALTAGICGTQLASTTPLRKKVVESAQRERNGGDCDSTHVWRA